jgi:hypothetical protein
METGDAEVSNTADSDQIAVAYTRHEWTCPHCTFVNAISGSPIHHRIQECDKCATKVYVRNTKRQTAAEYLASYRADWGDAAAEDPQPLKPFRTLRADEEIQATGIDYINNERAMQIRKGFTRERNIARDGWRSLVRSGDCYFVARIGDAVPAKWDLSASAWHPRGAFWNLVRAGALYLSALEIVRGGPEDPGVEARVKAAALEIDRLLWETAASSAKSVIMQDGSFVRAMAYDGKNADALEKWAYPVWKRDKHPVETPISSLGLSVGDYVLRLPDGSISTASPQEWSDYENGRVGA